MYKEVNELAGIEANSHSDRQITVEERGTLNYTPISPKESHGPNLVEINMPGCINLMMDSSKF